MTGITIDAFVPTGMYRSLVREDVTAVDGEIVASLGMSPAPLVARAVRSLRALDPSELDQRAEIMTRAAELFLTGEYDGLDRNAYERVVARATGMGVSLMQASTARLAERMREARALAERARPGGAVFTAAELSPGQGGALWVRRGNTFGVLAAGNHPGVNGNWFEALALGYAVIVRPSRREPFTGSRLVAALRDAGLDHRHLAFVPGGHDVADAIVRATDLAMVYGGDEVMRTYASSDTVLPQGPGRSKIVITDGGVGDHLDVVVESIAGSGGVACTNATALFIDGDPVEAAASIAEHLNRLPSAGPLDPSASLPVVPLADAQRLVTGLRNAADGAIPILGADDVAVPYGETAAVLRPAVYVVPSSSDPRLGAELPFPCVWVTRWSPSDGIDPLRGSLVLTILGDGDGALTSSALAEPSIRTVHVGTPTNSSTNAIPHDDFLGAFLMESRGFVTA